MPYYDNTMNWVNQENHEEGVILTISGNAPVTITIGADIYITSYNKWRLASPGRVVFDEIHAIVRGFGSSTHGDPGPERPLLPTSLIYQQITSEGGLMDRTSSDTRDITSIRLHRDPRWLLTDPNDDPRFQAARRQVQADEARRRAAEAAERDIHYGIPQTIPQTINEAERENRRRQFESWNSFLPGQKWHRRGVGGNVLKKKYYYSKKRSTRRSKSLRRNKSLRRKY